MKFKTKFFDFFRLVFPSTLQESLLFAVLLLFYGVFSTYIALNFRIIFDDRIPWDAYFSFDNRAIVMTGGGFERHPLSNYFFEWLKEFAYIFSGGKKDEVFRLVLACCSTVTISLGIVQIFKYLKNIIRIPSHINWFIVVFFSFFTTPILLSFTPETYTYTFFLLVLFNYYAALKLRNNQKIPTIALTLAGVSVGGLTITNVVKVYIPILFEEGIFKNWKKFGNAVFRVLISVIVFVLLYLNRLNFDWQKIFSKTGEQYEKFSKPKVTPVWDMIISWFFGGNMLFPSFVIRDYHNKKGFQYKALFMDVYSGFLPYAFIGLLLLLVFWSYFKNFRNKYVQILMISFFVDIIIHAVFKFGLHTSYIYGGHFVFVVPMMLGWLFFGYRNSPKTLSFLMIMLSLLFIYLVTNNVTRLEEFFVFLEKFYH